jgi:transcriptional regulator with XRE-family HTH domain
MAVTERAAFSPHRQFADNLRALCAQHGSIAAVCAAIGMNRQQFNKYLAGSTLPNAPALERICSFFRIDPAKLFQPEPAAPAAPAEAWITASQNLDAMRLTTMRPGCYHLYMPWRREASKCLRAALIVYRKDGLTLFARYNKYRAPGHRQRYFVWSRQDGMVLEQGKLRYLAATQHKGAGGMSLVSFGVEGTLNGDFISGLALDMDPSGNPVAVRATLEYRGDASLLRRTIAEACILPLSDPSIAEEVRQSVSAAAPGRVPCLEAFSLLDSLPRQSRRNGAS